MKKIMTFMIIMSVLLFDLACKGKDSQGSELDCSVTYSEGCEILDDKLTMEFAYCYPPEISGNTFSFANHSDKVFMLEMSASWWSPCYASIPEGDEIYANWASNDSVKILHFLDDIGQPTSCEAWGNHGTIGIPTIADGTSITNHSMIIEWFASKPGSSGTPYPVTIFINHAMQVESIYYSSLGIEDVNHIIRRMLDDM